MTAGEMTVGRASLAKAALAATGTLAVRLEDAVGHPLPHCEVRVTLPNGHSVTVRTDAGGVAEVPLPSLGYYEVDVLQSGKLVTTWSLPMTESRETVQLQLKVPSVDV